MADHKLRGWALLHRLIQEGVVVYGTLFVVLVGVGLWYCFDDTGGSSKTDTASQQAGQFRSAILSYYSRHQSYPESLDDLVVEKNGRQPPIDGGPSALLDPWGNKFQFEIITNRDGYEDVAVWTVTPQGKRIESLGTRR
jgi:type II secretory pathway pseudopilin PulG